jgi:integrase
MPRPAEGQLMVREGKRGLVYAARFRAYGQRRYVTFGSAGEGWDEPSARKALAHILADVERGIWQPTEPTPAVEEPSPVPDFHTFASKWFQRRRQEVGARTAEHWQWALSVHLLPVFQHHRLSAITIEEVDRYKAVKLGEKKPLSASSINKTLKVLAQVLDDAVAYGHITDNPARGKRSRLKASRPRRTWLEADEAAALIKAAGDHRCLLAVMTLAGLRVSEAAGLRWRSVDLARAKLSVEESKTDAGHRDVDLSPMLLDELKLRKADTEFPGPDDFVFATRNGTCRQRSNITRQILVPAIEAANNARAKAGRPPIQAGVTNHSLRRTFASLLYEAGASPAYVMSQMGHTSSALALEVYARKMERSRDTGARMDALIRGADWALTGTNAETEAEPVAVLENEKAAFEAAS